MSLRERVYSVLVVSASQKFNEALEPLLSPPKYGPVRTVSTVNGAKRALLERSFDYVIINAPLPDDPGTRLAIDACDPNGTVVLLMVRADLHDEIYDEVVEHGVFTLAKPVSKATFLTALNWMASARERLQKSQQRTLSMEEKMEEIRLVNRAKWLLISELKMDEPQAHRYIEKQAMDRCVTRREIAKEIIRTYL